MSHVCRGSTKQLHFLTLFFWKLFCFGVLRTSFLTFKLLVINEPLLCRFNLKCLDVCWDSSTADRLRAWQVLVSVWFPCSRVRPPAAPFMPHVSQPCHCPTVRPNVRPAVRPSCSHHRISREPDARQVSSQKVSLKHFRVFVYVFIFYFGGCFSCVRIQRDVSEDGDWCDSRAVFWATKGPRLDSDQIFGLCGLKPLRTSHG